MSMRVKIETLYNKAGKITRSKTIRNLYLLHPRLAPHKETAYDLTYR